MKKNDQLLEREKLKVKRFTEEDNIYRRKTEYEKIQMIELNKIMADFQP